MPVQDSRRGTQGERTRRLTALVTPQLMQSFHRIVMRDFTALGGALFYFLVVLAALALGWNALVLELLAGAAVIYAVTVGIKAVYFKDRPERMGYRSFLGRLEASAFPSVHSARAFLLAMLISQHYSRPAMSLTVFAVAGTVAYSRIYLKKHDIVDVAAGAVLGVLIGWSMFRVLGPLPFP